MEDLGILDSTHVGWESSKGWWDAERFNAEGPPHLICAWRWYSLMIQSLGSGATCLGFNLFEPQHSPLGNRYHNRTQLRKGYCEDLEWHNVCQLLSKVSAQLKVTKTVNTQEAGEEAQESCLGTWRWRQGSDRALPLMCCVNLGRDHSKARAVSGWVPCAGSPSWHQPLISLCARLPTTILVSLWPLLCAKPCPKLFIIIHSFKPYHTHS